MIVSVAYKPTYLSPAYNNIIWSVASSMTNQVDFKYVFDIYMDNVKIARIKQRANPSGYGMIDVATILQGYIESTTLTAPITQGETEIDFTNGKFFQDNYGLSKHVYLKVGEEYTSNGGTNIYNGVTDTIGEPAFITNSGNTTLSIPVHTWSASLTDHEQQWNMQKVTESGVFGGDPFQYNKIYDHGLGLAYPLNFNKLNQYLYSYDKMVLSWLNWSPYPSQEDRPIAGFRYTIVHDGTTTVYDAPMITATGYAQRTLATDTVPAQLDSKYDIVHVLASPKDIMTAANITYTTLTSIKVQGYNKGFLAPVTQPVMINILEECPGLYPRTRLSWINTLGGRDYLNFTMLTEKSTNVKSDKYAQEQMNWNAATPVPLNNNALPIGNLGIRGGDKTYNKQADISYKIETDWLTQEEMVLVEGLIKAPQAMAYIHEPGNTLSDYYPYTCMVTQQSYTTKNVRQVKLYQASFDIQIMNGQKIQNF